MRVRAIVAFEYADLMYRPGDVFDAPEEDVDDLIEDGFVVPVGNEE